MTEHAWKDTVGFWIFCACEWSNFSLLTAWNERALRKHIEMHRWAAGLLIDLGWAPPANGDDRAHGQ